jgi:hypothetical protein
LEGGVNKDLSLSREIIFLLGVVLCGLEVKEMEGGGENKLSSIKRVLGCMYGKGEEVRGK